ncbi:MAG: hypothetical protein WA615_07225, partial [Bradyrhizobium sp.]|uniref:hypothetical protein n=1 Tax=Bradyrhizobium sp. TaxID=376 RepID=UPI003C7B9214
SGIEMARRVHSGPIVGQAYIRPIQTLHRSVVHKQRKNKDDRKRDTDQPKQSTFTKAHDSLHDFN